MKFLVVTDLHYSDKPTGNNNRYHAMSLDKVRQAIESYSDGCEFIVCLGDIVDSFEGFKPQIQGLTELRDMLDSFGIPFYPTFGNHDTALDKRDFMRLIGMKDRYYSFETEEYLLLMLDSSMNSKTEPYPQKEIIWTQCYVDDEQLSWMRDKISSTDKKVVVMTHALISPGTTDDEDHIILNADEITDILFEYEDKIAAVFCGHYHNGHSAKIGSIPYVVFKALCMGTATTCAVVEINDGKVIITGYGDEPSIQINK